MFETYEVDVLYRYDRTHENMDDKYVAEIPEMGLEFLFDSSQHLSTIFMKKVDHNGFKPFDGHDPRSVPFQTGIEAIEWAKETKLKGSVPFY